MERLVRVAIAGSVDDGKSTLIGRLLQDTGSILEDQYAAVERASRQTGESATNLALLTDGLKEERDQKITIDVAYRHFRTAARRYLLADTPGHAQYTRNMVVGASTADVAMLLVDAERGPTLQTRRHAFLASMLRVPHLLVVVNKMDALEYRREAYESLVEDLRHHMAHLEFGHLQFLPVSALTGENVVDPSDRMPWHQGGSLLQVLDGLEVGTRRTTPAFRFLFQVGLRPHAGFRGYAGQVVSGSIRVGEDVVVQPAGVSTRIRGIHVLGKPVPEASAGQPCVLEFADDVDASRGDLLSRPGNPASVGNQVDALLCWMGERPSGPRAYRLLLGTAEAGAQIEELVYEVNPESLHRERPERLAANAIARVRLRLSRPVAADPYSQGRDTGLFALIESDTFEVAAAGVVNRIESAAQGRLGLVVWLTGLSGAGKSTLAEGVRRERGGAIVHLDGDALRRGLNRDLGFSESDRSENLRRAAEIAKLLSQQGFDVICSFISPLATHRQAAREIIGEAFREVYVECPIETLRARDPKGLYARADRGEIPDFTGVGAPYEPPDQPDLTLRTDQSEPAECIRRLLAWIADQGITGFPRDLTTS